MHAKKFEPEFLVDTEFLQNFNSIHTRKSYQQDLEQFADFLKLKYPLVFTFSQVSRQEVIDYKNFLIEVGGKDGTPLAPKSVARKLASLSSYFDYLIEHKNLMELNPCSSVKRPRLEVVKPTMALTKDQVQSLFDAIDDNKASGKLHKALIVTLFTTGLRKSEILNLKFKSYRDINYQKVFEYLGKGGKIRMKAIHPLAIRSIEDYLAWMKEQDRGHEPEDWFFQPTRNPSNPKNLNKSINPRTVNEILRTYSLKTGINFSVSPHSARATFITVLLDQGIPISDVAKEVSHESIKTTQIYDKRRQKLENSLVYKISYDS